jgi:hypothetical protein
MTKIDIEKLTESELIDLNNRIILRLKFLRQMRSHRKMLEFTIGERVTFHPEGYPRKFGTIMKYNKKTITVITEDGEHWNVSPGLLQKVKVEQKSKQQNQNVIPFRKKNG